MMKPTSLLFAVLALLGIEAIAQSAPALDAAASDPTRLGWMQGTPPPPDQIIGFDDGGFRTFPMTRWSFSNYRQFVPSVSLRRGTVPVHQFPRSDNTEIDAVIFTLLGSDQAMSWKDSLAANYTDGIVVLHRGQIVYERYFGVTAPETQHIAFSVTKSFVGTLASILVAEGRLDPEKPVTHYVPELAKSGFAGATVRQVMDMTTGIAFDETYTNPNADIFRYGSAGRMRPRAPGYDGPEGFLAFLPTIGPQGEHGERFTYRTANTDTLGWIIARAGGAPLREQLEARLWSKLGMERDAAMAIDAQGTVWGGGGLIPTLRDMARFGEMMRMGGKWNGQQIVPPAALDDIVRGGDREKFAKNAAYPTLPGWSYRNQWWVSHNEHGVYMARGVHGQAIYIDPRAEMVIARFASHPVAGNVGNDPTSLPAYHEVARHLMGTH